MKLFLILSVFLLCFSCSEKVVEKSPLVTDRTSFFKSPDSKLDPGVISGQVLNLTDDSAIAGAIVTIKRGREVITTTVTDDKGFFKIIGLPAQVYHVTAEARDFSALTIGSVPVTAGAEVTTHFILIPVASSEYHILSAFRTDVSKRKI